MSHTLPSLDELGLESIYGIPSDLDQKIAPVKVVFVRHGESTWNKSGKFTGWIDVPLNETGRE